MAQSKVLSRQLSGGTEERYEKPQSGYPVSGLRSESETFRTRSRIANHLTATLDGDDELISFVY
jgi:hypothetical protein